MKHLITLGLCVFAAGFSIAQEPAEKSITDRLRILENNVNFLNSDIHTRTPAQFHCFNVDEQGFVLIGREGWLFTVSLEDIKPYTNGSEITFSIGNLLGVSLSEITFSSDIWYSKTKRETTKFTITRLDKGHFIRQKVRLSNVPPSQIDSVCTALEKVSGLLMTEQK